jgi:hypothetical protein
MGGKLADTFIDVIQPAINYTGMTDMAVRYLSPIVGSGYLSRQPGEFLKTGGHQTHFSFFLVTPDQRRDRAIPSCDVHLY